jgi:hypothetical protein
MSKNTQYCAGALEQSAQEANACKASLAGVLGKTRRTE